MEENPEEQRGGEGGLLGGGRFDGARAVAPLSGDEGGVGGAAHPREAEEAEDDEHEDAVGEALSWRRAGLPRRRRRRLGRSGGRLDARHGSADPRLWKAPLEGAAMPRSGAGGLVKVPGWGRTEEEGEAARGSSVTCVPCAVCAWRCCFDSVISYVQ